jgi:hypothetical protein
MFKKIIGTVLVAAFAASMIVAPASAHNPNQKGPVTSIFPALLGPLGFATLIGPGTSTALATKALTFKFWHFKWIGAYHDLTQAGWNVSKDIIWKDFHGHKIPKKVKLNASKQVSTKSKLKIGKTVVGCVMGSAFGAISASIRKASALGNPPRWRSQAEHERIVASGAEKKYELTSDEAATALSACGLGSFALHWPQGNI